MMKRWATGTTLQFIYHCRLGGVLLSLLLPVSATAGPLEHIRLPAGFTIDTFADNLPDARSLALGDKGTVFVGNRRADKVYALVDGNGDGKAEQRYVVAQYLDTPNGIAFYKGDLFVAENHRILRFADIESHLADPPKPVVIYDKLPTRTHHGWRYLAAGPDGWLYISIGAPCNICNEGPPFASIYRLRPDGSHFQPFATGIRNSIGFAWQPQTHVMWFTDNGRDWLGDDAPPDELNRADRPGLFFGYPYRHGRNIVDPEFGDKAPTALVMTPPALELGAHVAALGLRFYTGTMFPPEFHKRLFIAEHGSWNRSTPVGYRIEMVTVRDGKVTGHEVFADGWLKNGRKWGRPADLLVMPDGALLVSDDMNGAVYRISYHSPKLR